MYILDIKKFNLVDIAAIITTIQSADDSYWLDGETILFIGVHRDNGFYLDI